MIRKTKKARKYFSPSAKVTHMALESNFCQTVRFNVEVQQLENINSKVDALGNTEEPMYFEF